jgi:hypothetical protein
MKKEKIKKNPKDLKEITIGKEVKTPKHISEEKIAEALRLTHGLQYLAAEALNIHGGSLSQRINNSEYLKQVRDECREKRLDIAELNLTKLTEEMSLGAICFLLKTQGKSRGYVESNQVIVDQETVNSFGKLMNQMSEMQKTKEKTDILE